MSANKRTWGLWNNQKQGFIKGYLFWTKKSAERHITDLTNRKRDPITNHFRNNVWPKEFKKPLETKR